MSAVDDVVEQIKQLPEEQRDDLFWMLDDMHGPRDPDRPIRITKETWDLLEERSAAYEANPSEVYTWEEVVAHVKRGKPAAERIECPMLAGIKRLTEAERDELFGRFGELFGDRLHELFGDEEDSILITDDVSCMLETCGAESADCTWEELVVFAKSKK